MERRSPIALLTTFFTMLALSIFFNACNRMTGDIEPQNSKSPVAQKDSYARLSTADCSSFYNPVLNQSQRDRAVALYGAAGGTAFDSCLGANLGSNYVSNYSSLVFSYMNQITIAITNGATAYANTICVSVIPACTGINVYLSSAFKSHIDGYLAPIRTSVQSDPALTTEQRSVIQNALSALDSNFEYVSSQIEGSDLINGMSSCFPNPAWYGGGLMMQPMGVLFGIGKVLRKVVNIVATVVIRVVEDAFKFGVWGALVATPFLAILGVPALVAGVAIGALIGFTNGVTAVLQGNYTCILYPCP